MNKKLKIVAMLAKGILHTAGLLIIGIGVHHSLLRLSHITYINIYTIWHILVVLVSGVIGIPIWTIWTYRTIQKGLKCQKK